MSSNNGAGGIHAHSFALQRNSSLGIPTITILPNMSEDALREFAANLRNTGFSLEQRLNSQISLHSDGHARLAIPAPGNGLKGFLSFKYINLDSHEAKVLAGVLQGIGFGRVETSSYCAYLDEARKRLQEFVELYS